MKSPLTALFVAASLLFSTSIDAAQNPPPAVDLSHAAAEEIAIGQQIHATILSSFYPYTEPNVLNYVDKIGQALALHSERRELPYKFTILYSDKIYATSSPGGFIYITTGMLYFLENEAQLAAVLAHEIGELQYKDPGNSKAKKMLESVTRGGAMVAPAFGQIGALAALGLVALNQVSGRKSKGPEAKLSLADQKALHYMMEAGQDPQGMMDLFYKFLNTKEEITPYFFDYYQSRPITQERTQALTQSFSKLPLEGKSFTTNRELYQEMTKGVREIYNRS